MAPDAPDVPRIAIAPAAPHMHTVVFLHGRGDNVHSFVASLAAAGDSHGRTLADALPSFRWVFPQAPMRPCASQPQTAWPQWFDMWDTRDFAAREELQAEGLRASVQVIRRDECAHTVQLRGACIDDRRRPIGRIYRVFVPVSFCWRDARADAGGSGPWSHSRSGRRLQRWLPTHAGAARALCGRPGGAGRKRPGPVQDIAWVRGAS